MKILNLYSGIGGNRKLWDSNYEITAIEHSKEIAEVYKDYFPNDKVIIGDAHDFLLKNYMDYDFIWSSPPCPTHSRMRYTCTKHKQKTRNKLNVVYPDMALYQEIILLSKYFKGKYIIENVIPYYKPLIPGKKIGRHILWSNFDIPDYKTTTKKLRGHSMEVLQKDRGFDLSKYKMKQRKDTILLNCVDSELGLYLLNCAVAKSNINHNGHQTALF